MKEADEHSTTDERSIFDNHVKQKTVVRLETRNVKLLHFFLHLVAFIVEEEIYLAATVTQREGKRSNRCTWGRPVIFLSCCEAGNAAAARVGTAPLAHPVQLPPAKGPPKSDCI